MKYYLETEGEIERNISCFCRVQGAFQVSLRFHCPEESDKDVPIDLKWSFHLVMRNEMFDKRTSDL